MINLIETQKAYIAGLFDGEGTIGFYLKKSIGYHRVSLAIYNSDLRVLEWLSTLIPDGKIYKNRTSPHPVYQWQLQKYSTIKDLLIAIKPYLIIKLDQVNLLLSFWDAEAKIRDSKKLSNDVLNLRTETEIKLKELKTSNLTSIH